MHEGDIWEKKGKEDAKSGRGALRNECGETRTARAMRPLKVQ